MIPVALLLPKETPHNSDCILWLSLHTRLSPRLAWGLYSSCTVNQTMTGPKKAFRWQDMPVGIGWSTRRSGWCRQDRKCDAACFRFGPATFFPRNSICMTSILAGLPVQIVDLNLHCLILRCGVSSPGRVHHRRVPEQVNARGGFAHNPLVAALYKSTSM